MGYVVRRIDALTQAALEALGEVLRELRAERGLSQSALAARSGLSQSTISRLEGGKAPGFKVVALARLLAGLERGSDYSDTVWLTPAAPGWQQLMAAFSTTGRFAERLRVQRAEARRDLLDRMHPRASRVK
jgi:transcriptional regulator with XRE-family HTH domain